MPGRTLLSDFARDTVAVLDHLGLRRAVIAGLSMGGQIAMEFQRQYPEQVSALVLAEGIAGYAADVIDKMIAPHHVTGQPDVAAHVLGMMRTTAPQGAAAALRGRAERPDYRQTLAAVRVPTLIVVGAEDPYTPIDQAKLMHDLIAGATLAVIDDAAHLPNLKQRARFNTTLLRFLDTHRPAH